MSTYEQSAQCNQQPLSSGKFELLDALWESLETETPALTDAQRTELDDRVATYKQNPAAIIPWEQVKADLLKMQ